MWKNLVSQLRKWLVFCDEEGRSYLPGEEGDVLAYIGYLALKRRVGPRSARQFVTTVSRHHEDAEYVSPTKTQLVANLLKKVNRTSEAVPARAGINAAVMRRVVQVGWSCKRGTWFALSLCSSSRSSFIVAR